MLRQSVSGVVIKTIVRSSIRLLFSVGIALPKPYIDGYNTTNVTCPLNKYLGQYTGIGGICPPGTFCERGSAVPEKCKPGTYNDVSGKSKCMSCPSGYYCLTETIDYKLTICPTGYYCPSSTEHANQYPCPPGTFNNLTGQQSESSCEKCPPGMYCEGFGNSWPTGYCSAGWYCSGNATSNKTTLHGGMCQPGYYCNAGSTHPRECDGGKFCDVSELESPTGNCSAGYYCRKKSRFASPTDGTTGNECPKGYFCLEGTRDPTPCPPGKYNDALQATDSSSCKPCTRGMYCNGTALEEPKGDCSAGWYCPPGQVSRTPASYPCPAGSYCKEGVDRPEKCPSGFYQNEAIKDFCKTCPENYYCNATFGGVVNYDSYLCPPGYYCPNGTRFAEEYPCDYGTFSNGNGLARQEQCSSCLGGYYCGQKGLTTPVTPCSPGFYCKEGKVM